MRQRSVKLERTNDDYEVAILALEEALEEEELIEAFLFSLHCVRNVRDDMKLYSILCYHVYGSARAMLSGVWTLRCADYCPCVFLVFLCSSLVRCSVVVSRSHRMCCCLFRRKVVVILLWMVELESMNQKNRVSEPKKQKVEDVKVVPAQAGIWA